MNTNSFFNKMLLSLCVLFMYSCDKDYNEIGGAIIGGNNFDLTKVSYDVLAYTQKTGAVQSNNMDINPLGIYSDSNYGETTANINTQVSLSAPLSSIGGRLFVESVILTIPYFTDPRQTKLNVDGSSLYVLDSIYGAEKAIMKLGVYESGYFMRDSDPITGFQQQQQFYSDENNLFDSRKFATILNDSPNKSQNEEFFFDAAERAVVIVDSITTARRTTYIKPEMRLELNKSYFKTRILDEVSTGKLASNDVFKNYFRGLYFKMEKSGNRAGNLAMLNFNEGKITITYKEDLASPIGGAPTREKKTLVLNLSGNKVSLLNNDFSASGSTFNTLPKTGNTTEGDDRLFLKGGEGSVAILELFNKTDVKGYDAQGNLTSVANGVSDELDDLRYPANGKKLLVNEANLVFHIDANAMANSVEPQRIYLYDYINSNGIIDYFSDQTTSTTDPKRSRVLFDGIINKDAITKRGSTYKIRVTDQIRNLINNKDFKNVKLGLAVTENIANSIFYSVRTPDAFISKVPMSSVQNPLGTILFSGKATVPADKKLKLEIYFTKPN
ncbi:protein of unknown function [Flavobacterium micromati]|uniref:DUF4270 domain-containing protein n=1 Tax=Flavobacterium micromati TaxID=229205 RepID=A0A1M5LIV2_9FLAO|nr:DUF4270 domain-containing protein [Flavobacterium micromati]SHG64293.1 protein of unknown function [Flavobacterium micromati]